MFLEKELKREELLILRAILERKVAEDYLKRTLDGVGAYYHPGLTLEVIYKDEGILNPIVEEFTITGDGDYFSGRVALRMWPGGELVIAPQADEHNVKLIIEAVQEFKERAN